MSLARAFTKRSRSAQRGDAFPHRTLTTKGSFSSGSIRHKISAPLELVSTTNMLSYNAPDIYPTAGSSASASSSGDESDALPSLTHSPGGSTHHSTSAASSPGSPEPNHLSCYFTPARASASSAEGAPAIPQRALSHTKRTHEALHRQRSISRLSGQAPRHSRASAAHVSHASLQMFSTPTPGTADAAEPFGAELAQVSEMVEELAGPPVRVADAEEAFLAARGLCKFAAQDYLREIEPLFRRAFGPGAADAWI